MGLWGRITSKVRETASKVVDAGKKAVTYVKEKVTNTWNSFTGKKTFEEAEQLYEEVSNRYNQRKSRFDSDVDRLTDQIEAHVKRINDSKSRIKTDLFTRMAAGVEQLLDVSISKEFSLESYKGADLRFDEMRTKGQLYRIDFNKNKFKTSVQAIFTLGFYTRKKAKETLYAVQEEELKIHAEIAKMNAEVGRLSMIEESLRKVAHYFASLTDLYEQLLARLDHSVHYLHLRSLQIARQVVRQEMSIGHLPVVMQKELEALVTSSMILKAMTDAQVTSLEDADKVEAYENQMKKQHDEMNYAYSAA
jgi:hypothetical protein